MVRFAKHGFAEHRTFTDIESFTEDCIAWLRRTANHDRHGTTYQRPDEVFALEREYLVPVSEYSFTTADTESIDYPVRKDNIVLYQGKGECRTGEIRGRYGLPISSGFILRIRELSQRT